MPSLQFQRSILNHNVATFKRQPISEISGALGDLGTFLPIVIALTEGRQISLSSTLVFTGIYNIATGLLFGIPLPVQPMKAIAAVAILKSLSAGEVAAAGIFVSLCILFFSVTKLLEWITDSIPIPVVKGIQVGAGLSLIIAAGSKALVKLEWTGPSWADNMFWLIVAFVLLFLTNSTATGSIGTRGKLPYALIVLVVGIVFAIIQLSTSHHYRLPRFRSWSPYVFTPTAAEWKIGIISAGLGQLPLTTLNSIIAVSHLATDLLPEIATPSVTSIGVSVAAMNLVGCWFGVMPTCHGSGGLAAQYRFGARSGASIIFLGLIKLLLGLVFGESLTELLRKFPLALLTVMVIAAGLELASVGESLNNTSKARDLRKEGHVGSSLDETRSRDRWTVMLVTAGTLVAFKNDAVGFLAGMCCHWSYQLSDRLERRRQKSRDQGESERQPLLT